MCIFSAFRFFDFWDIPQADSNPIMQPAARQMNMRSALATAKSQKKNFTLTMAVF